MNTENENVSAGVSEPKQKETIWHKEIGFRRSGAPGDQKKEMTLHKEIVFFKKTKNPRQKTQKTASDNTLVDKNQKLVMSPFDKLKAGKTKSSKNSAESIWKKEVSLWPKREHKAGWSLPKRATRGQLQATSARTDLIEEKPKAKPISKVKQSKTEPKSGRAVFVKIAKKSAEAIAFSAAFILLFSSAAVFAYQDQYKDRAFYGTKIFGEDVGGKTKGEIQNILDKKIAGITLNFEIDGQVITSAPLDAGVEFNAVGSANDAITKGKVGKLYQKWAYATSSLIYKISPKAEAKVNGFSRDNLEIKYSINDGKLALFAQGLSAKFNIDSQNAGLVMNGTEVTVIPAVYGRKIVADNIKYQIQEAIKKTDTNKIQIAVEKVNPAILGKDTKDSIDAAKKLISIPVTYHYQGQNFTPDKATVGSWVIFNTQDVGGKQNLVPAIDSKRVYPYIFGLGSKINVPAINKKVTIENGAKQTVNQEGKDGLAVDVNSASVTTASAMNGGSAINLELPTYVVKFKTQVNNVLVADWAKYIEINISTQRMTAYLAGGQVVGTWPVTTGRSGWSTPTGTFLILSKVYVTSMPNPPSPYPLKNIHYVSYFTGAGHAIHEAWWRSSFGGQDYVWNGSHGCVNASMSTATFIYNWAPIGTPVIIHY